MKRIVLFPKRSKKTQGILDLEAACSDFGNGRSVYFNETPAFLIIVICSQTGMGRNSFKCLPFQ